MERTTSRQKSNVLSFSMKGNKYKNFLTSILSPSTKKRHSRQKLARSHQCLDSPLQDQGTFGTTSIPRDQEANESIYSSIEDVKSASCPRKSSIASDTLSCKSLGEVSKAHKFQNKTDVQDELIEEPVYAIVHKPPLKPKRRSFIVQSDFEALNEVKEDNKMLLQRLKEISEENCRLKKQVQEIEKYDKMKDTTLHSKLQLEITRLEANTRKEVGSLSERIEMLVEEKSLLSDQLDQVLSEKRELQTRCEALTEDSRKKVDPEFHSKTVAEYRKLLEHAKHKHSIEVKEFKEQCEALEDTKKSLETLLQDARSNLASAQAKIKVLEDENKVMNEDKIQLTAQVEESRQIEEEHQKLLLSLLKVTETLAVDRDILLDKTSFQENQQKELQSSVVGYSLNIGRLQEHITNLSKENVQELLKLHSNKSHNDESVHEHYAKQLDLLREKIFIQEDIITKIASEKRQLELQMENRWESYSS